jgi:hypothetical protein
LVRISDPPKFDVQPDGRFKIEHVPLRNKGRGDQPLLEVYPIEEVLSKGYAPVILRISQHQGAYGGGKKYSVHIDSATKTIEIQDAVSVIIPKKEAPPIPYLAVERSTVTPIPQ